GQVYPTAIVILVGLIVAAVWIWKRLPAETQDYAVDQALPVAAGGAAVAAIVLAVLLKIRQRAAARRERNRLIRAFQREPAQEKKLDLSFALIECNTYRLDGLEEIAPALKDLWVMTLGQAVEDKQHRIRGMAASHLGVLQDQSVAPLLVKALKDDHAYVRACAALGLGRLRATDARDRLTQVAEEDGDQTVRSRAREALERMRN
ncbi:MAG: HEAT repeat domain-containing protein, partial [Nitrospira sp.]|nr:HEAT repeat domain-containing protein [Nitrospira sp.]